jgi:hypothetical protein
MTIRIVANMSQPNRRRSHLFAIRGGKRWSLRSPGVTRERGPLLDRIHPEGVTT